MKFKSFVSGIVIGAVLATTISVFAIEDGQVGVWVTDHYKIMLDNKIVELPEDMHILNYQDRIYTPTRLVAEAMGGQVGWDGVQKIVYISAPTPEPIEIPAPTPEPEPEPMETARPNVVYQPSPIKLRQNDCIVNVFGMTEFSMTTNLHIDVRNERMEPVNVGYKDAYIEVDGVKYRGREEQFMTWGNSIATWSELANQQMSFDKIPAGTKKMLVVIPLEYTGYVDGVGTTRIVTDFRMYIEFGS